MILLQYGSTKMEWPEFPWVELIIISLLLLLFTALVFRWILSVRRQIRQNDRLFELMGRIAEQQGISREEVRHIHDRYISPMSSDHLDRYYKDLKQNQSI